MRTGSSRRASKLALAGLLVGALSLTTVATADLAAAQPAPAPPAGERAPTKGPARPERTPPVKADRDRDKIFDDLEEGLATTGADQRVPVLVMLSSEASPAAIDRMRRE